MVRIAGSVDPNVREADYLNAEGRYTIGPDASPTMLQSVMYSLTYHRFGEVFTEMGKPSGFDRVRQTEIGRKDVDLKYLEEVFTSEHWLVRIYRVKKEEELIGYE